MAVLQRVHDPAGATTEPVNNFLGGGRGSYANYLLGPDPNGVFKLFFGMFSANNPYYRPNGHPPPAGYPQNVNGVAQRYYFMGMPGVREMEGRWGLTVDFLRALGQLKLNMSDSTETRMFTKVSAIFNRRGATAASYMESYTQVVNSLAPVSLATGPIPNPVLFDMKSVDMVSILYVVDLKSLYLNSGVYAYATWLSELKQDLNTYASLSYYVRSKFRRVLGGSERRLILSKLLNACKDFFITREIESFFPFLNFEYSPGILGANQPNSSQSSLTLSQSVQIESDKLYLD
jgi:hypothetical protein